MTNDLEEILDEEIGEPSYVRKVKVVSDSLERDGYIYLWLPKLAKNGGWISIIQTSWMHEGKYSIAPGNDEIGSLLFAFHMMSSFFYDSNDNIMYNNENFGGIPIWGNNFLSRNSKNMIVKFIKDLEKEEFSLIQ